jgi:hypothetical protein
MKALAWVKPAGAEYVSVEIGAGWLSASGVAVGAQPLPYHLDYVLTCENDYVTRQLSVRTFGAGWGRSLDLSRDLDGTWHIADAAEGDVDLPPAGGDPATLAGALDCDLGLSPLTNTMPVLRDGLLAGGAPVDLLMAWVSVPDLSVHRDAQRYTFVRPVVRAGGGAIINYSSDGFSADISFDATGLVVDYPGIASRA